MLVLIFIDSSYNNERPNFVLLNIAVNIIEPTTVIANPAHGNHVEPTIDGSDVW